MTKAVQMRHTELLALYMAMERRRGEASFWAPYIRSLPLQVPCAWAMKPNVAAAALKQHGGLPFLHNPLGGVPWILSCIWFGGHCAGVGGGGGWWTLTIGAACIPNQHYQTYLRIEEIGHVTPCV